MDTKTNTGHSGCAVDAHVERVIENSGFVQRAARMADSHGLTGVEAVHYATSLVEEARQRLRTNLAEQRAEVRQHVKSIIDHPAAQGQPKRALELALDPNIDQATAISTLKQYIAGQGDASALAQSILKSRGE